MILSDKNISSICEHLISTLIFISVAALYFSCVDHSASFWDCPEYITCASLLEIGHPPGNPIWMLAMRVATIPFAPEQHALVIGVCSGIFMAGAAYFISRITYCMALYVATKYTQRYSLSPVYIQIMAISAAISAAYSFALCDSAIFSATEAEVYAMSTFFMALVLWLATVWAGTYSHARQRRLLILIAYITGLSLGVHQLNLLCIPALALIYVFRKYPYGKCAVKAWIAIAVAFIVIALILLGMMGGVLDWAQELEILAVNYLGMPYFSGVYIYLGLLLIAVTATVASVSRGTRSMIAGSLFLFLWLSGMFVFSSHIAAAALVSAIISFATVYWIKWNRARLLTCVMSFAFILLGYSSFALILIRGYAAPPMNEGAPTDIFALASYIEREQYGKTPLLYGATPYSKPMVEERSSRTNGIPDYSAYVLKIGKPRYVPLLDAPRLNHRSRAVSHADSSANDAIIERSKNGYLLSDYSFTRVTSPELDMFLPRITGSSASDIGSYESWIGMTPESMDKVEISETFDSLGNPVGKIGPSGERTKTVSYRPTYLQNLKFFLSYQVGYMYFRYLLWNFMGRQNDIHSTGEIDHGNFITGFSVIDDAMLGKQSLMPAYANTENTGHHVYYGIPFLFGIIGIIFLYSQKITGRRTLAIIAMLFFMTGIAITIYLNQLPGEPRERDYSFLGSYMAFAIWIGFGCLGVGMLTQRLLKNEFIPLAVSFVAAVSLSYLLYEENKFIHMRKGRSEPYDFASGILLNEKPAIIFTQGDNFTFPMWYAQEVMNTGRQHTVIDASYFATPEYVVNLLKQGERGIRMTASPSDIAYGAYAYTRIAPDADTVPVPAIDALRELYSSRKGMPVFRHRRLTLPGKNIADTMTIDLKDFANGSSMLPFRKLMLLDLLATNAASETPRPVYFHSGVATDFYRPIASSTRKLPFVYSYDPNLPDSAYISTMAKALEPTLNVYRNDSSQTLFFDHVLMDQVRRQRGEIIMTANALLDAKHLGDAKFLETIAGNMYPYNVIPAGSFTIADSTYHEGIELAMLKMKISAATWDRTPAENASFIIKSMLKESNKWKQYYLSLPESRRKTVSNSTRRLISILPRLEEMDKDCEILLGIIPDPFRHVSR